MQLSGINIKDLRLRIPTHFIGNRRQSKPRISSGALFGVEQKDEGDSPAR